MNSKDERCGELLRMMTNNMHDDLVSPADPLDYEVTRENSIHRSIARNRLIVVGHQHTESMCDKIWTASSPSVGILTGQMITTIVKGRNHGERINTQEDNHETNDCI